MKTVCILGNFDFGNDTCSGQIIKTRMIAEEIGKRIQEVTLSDTAGGLKFLLKLPYIIFTLLIKHKNIIILPAQNGIHIIPLFLVGLNVFFRRKLHYVVIGGWLPDFLQQYWHLRIILKGIDVIYVETDKMKKRISKIGLSNTLVMPNCKSLNILTPKEVEAHDNKDKNSFPLKLCTFSRVMKEKGIEDAVHAVIQCNTELGFEAFSLDIFGKIINSEHIWFDNLMKNVPKYISYGGQIGYTESTDKLRTYYMLLFPTYYSGEGHAGTLIDALASGLPVIATDWHDNTTIITDGETGFITPIKDAKRMAQKLIYIYNNPELIHKMRYNCIEKAQDYVPDKIITILINELKK
ncbi:MAG: glycosyltransferase family 4 protein [Prevotella sp.]|nr:glycosyltransferase family 4 protein [Candidatus Equicola faecalis]